MTEFLREPALFPARIAGESWGSESCELELADERYRIEGVTALQLAGLRERYGARLQPPSQGGTVLQVFRAPASDFIDIDTRGWEYSAHLDWNERGFTLAGLRVMARVDGTRAGIWTSVEEPGEFSGVIENVLRPLLATRLLAAGGLLVHSAAIDGFLFAGHSGAGKSTIARMGIEAGLPVLSDDLNALVRDADGAFVIVPLPFTGDLDAAEVGDVRTLLRAVMSLEKGDHEKVRTMSIAETVSLLVRCAPYVNQDGAQLPLLLDRASEIAAGVRRGVLTFRRGAAVWPILEGRPDARNDPADPAAS